MSDPKTRAEYIDAHPLQITLFWYADEFDQWSCQLDLRSSSGPAREIEYNGEKIQSDDPRLTAEDRIKLAFRAVFFWLKQPGGGTLEQVEAARAEVMRLAKSLNINPKSKTK